MLPQFKRRQLRLAPAANAVASSGGAPSLPPVVKLSTTSSACSRTACLIAKVVLRRLVISPSIVARVDVHDARSRAGAPTASRTTSSRVSAG